MKQRKEAMLLTHKNKEERIMKQIKLEINIEACHYNELTEKDRKLIDAACEATKRSYAPYSQKQRGTYHETNQTGNKHRGLPL